MPLQLLPALWSSLLWRGCCGGAIFLNMATLALAASPSRYEISINGENFTLESDRIVKLDSADKPGTTYEVAIRVAQYQPWQLKGVKFDYHNGFNPTEDPAMAGRSVSFKHDLGFVMDVRDFGGALPEESRDKTLQLLVDTMQKTLMGSGAVKVDISKPAIRTTGTTSVRGVTLRYEDRDSVGRNSFVYLVTGPTFSCSVVVQCLDTDRESVMPMVKSTLDSFVALQK